MPIATRKRDAKGHFVSNKAKVTKKARVSTSRTTSVSRARSTGFGPSKQRPMFSPPPTPTTIPGRAKVSVYQDYHGEWRWNLKAGNGQIVADSGEGYATRWGCRRAARKALGL